MRKHDDTPDAADTHLRDLCLYLEAQQKNMIERWIRASRSDDALGTTESLSFADFRNNIPEALRVLREYLAQAGAEERGDVPMDEVREHGHHRWKQGFDLGGLIRDWGHLQAVVLQTVNAFFEETRPQDARVRSVAFERLGRYFSDASTASVCRYDEVRKSEAASVVADIESMQGKFDQLRRAQGRLLNQVAHDIRGGLTAISGASALLQEDVHALDASDSEALVGVINESIENVTELLEGLLSLSRLEAGQDQRKIASVDVAETLGALCENYQALAAEKDLEIRTSGPAHLQVQTDYDKVRRIVQNLILNAINYTSSGHVEVSWRELDHAWELVIGDRGPGLSEKTSTPLAEEINHPASGEDSVQEKEGAALEYEGEGIGLTIVKRLCEMLEASIALESRKGQGTEFRIRFPLLYSTSD